MENQLIKLNEPISPKWRVQSAFPKNAPTHVIMVSYVDARDVQDRLDNVVGKANWQSEFFECKGKQFCRIGIKVGTEWVWKGDSGSESSTEKEKGETSDAFKRAAVHWGINRASYQFGTVKLSCKEYNGRPYPISSNGNFLKGQELYEACNKLANVDEFVEQYQSDLKATINE